MGGLREEPPTGTAARGDGSRSAVFPARRAALVARGDLTPAQRRRAMSDAADDWLHDLVGAARGVPPDGLALVAVGGYGRRELLPGSDLDVLLLHDGSRPAAEVSAVADSVFYPVWDSGLALDHAVRTLAEARSVAGRDLKVALGLMDARPVAGDRALADQLRGAVLADWRRAARRRVPELAELSRERAARAGELAFLLEPDLVDAHGGLRDTVVLRAVAASWLADPPHGGVEDARAWLLAVREALHRTTGRRTDRLLLQEQDAVADLLRAGDADQALARVSEAGRTVAYALEVAWRSVDRVLRPERRGPRLPGRPTTGRRLGDGVAEHDGEAVLAPDARPTGDALLGLRAAALAAQAGLPLAPHSAARLAAECPPLPLPWPEEARDLLVALLGAGRSALPVWEALEAVGLVVRWLPEWRHIRFRPQRNVLHRHTVDRHSVEVVAEAAARSRHVSRPDLLLLAALLHDIGKGHPGDHSAVGAGIARGIADRLGLEARDADVVAQLVRHHLLLPVAATRRDLDDPATVAAVAEAVGDRDVLEMLAVLTEADAVAAGPSAWTPWRAALVGDLVARVRAALAGAPPPAPGGLEEWQQDLVLAGHQTVVAEVGDGGGCRVTVVAGDRPGLLATIAGVLVLHRLDVRGLNAQTREGTAVSVWRTVGRPDERPDPARLRVDVLRAIEGTLDVGARLAARVSSSPRPRVPVAPPRVDVLDGASARATVIEVRAHDRPGLLHRLAGVLSTAGVSIRSAVVGTLGAEAVDVFYVTDLRGRPLASDRAREVARRLGAAAAEGAGGPAA